MSMSPICLRASSALSAIRHQAQHGFTLIELMVTITIATILMMVAVPNFVQFRRNAALSDAVSGFITAANTARANAMKQGRNTFLIPNDDALGWKSGWLVFADADWSGTYAAGTDELLLSHEAVSNDVTITTQAGDTLGSKYLMFNGSGYPRMKNGSIATGNMVMNTAERSSTILVNVGGRVRSCKSGSTGCTN